MTSDINTRGALVLGVALQMKTPSFISDNKDSLTIRWDKVEDAFHYRVSMQKPGELVYNYIVEETDKLGWTITNLPLLNDPKGLGYSLYKFKV